MSAQEMIVRQSEEDSVELLILRHPPVNALSTGVIEELDRRLGELPASTRALIVTGDGAYFSAGADLKEMATIGLDHAAAIVARGHAVFARLAQFPAPVVAAINGLALGGGLELALACDLRVAGDSAKLGQPEVGYGLLPAYGGTQRLPRLIGLGKARELIYTGSMIPAAEALRIGLVNRVVPAGQELRAARDLAHTIASRAPRAVAAAKRALEEGYDRPLEEGLAGEAREFERTVLPSEDLLEGISAFAERRVPKFRGT
ncbi:MAG: enoyl-CoA hydratase/isomerase family protein [Thermoplasmata archaeon]